MGEVTGEIRGPLALRCCCRIIIIEDVAGGPRLRLSKNDEGEFQSFYLSKENLFGRKASMAFNRNLRRGNANLL